MSLDAALSISRIHFPVTTLGPGQRIGIWSQGCSIRCPGCISVDTWAKRPDNVTVDEVLSSCDMWGDRADGVTISGGEPFEQIDALGQLLAGIRDRWSSEVDILVYSGRSLPEIDPYIKKWSGLIDALISEPYLIAAGQTRPLVGSDNQVLNLLTDLGKRKYQSYDRQRTVDDDRLDIAFDEFGTAWMAGIPRQGDFERLRTSLSQHGTEIHTSEHIHQ